MATGLKMPLLTMMSRVVLYPLSRQCENGVAIVGRGDQFLELPPEGLHFIDWLNEGLTLAEARDRFEQTYSPFPDDEVLEIVEQFLTSDFVKVVDGQPITPRHLSPVPQAAWLRPEWARVLFSPPAFIAWMVFCVPAALFWVKTPALWPRPEDYFWTNYFFIIVLVDMLLGMFLIPMHELAHWLACRARGVSATITWTQRMGFLLMSQTVMHDIWAVPRHSRFLPLAAGMLWDVFGLCVVLYLFWLAQAGVLVLPLLAAKFFKFYLLAVTLGLMSQFWLFIKMDGYFLVSALIGQRNLQDDTFQWLKAKIWRKTTFAPPAGGMKAIYIYALIMLVGGGLFMGQILLVEIPIKLYLLWESALKLLDNSQVSPLDFADGVAVLASQGIYWLLLIYVYWRDTLPSWRRI